MKYQLLFENFIGMVQESVPQNTKISAVLADILQIEKEAVYRRLRMEVPFTFSEIATVSQSLGLSLDNIIGSIPKKSRPLKMTLVDYMDPTEVDYIMMENFVILLRQLAGQPGSEMGANCNTLPQALYYKYDNLNRFILFKWAYFTGTAANARPYGDIVIPERVHKNQLGHMEQARNFSASNFIWDKNCFANLVDDLVHFQSIYLLKPEEMAAIRNDIKNLLAEMEQIACNGCYPDTGKKVNFYVSSISFDTGYEYYENPNNKLGLMRTFLMNGTASMEERSFDKIKG